jgi:acyl CoA:acetate/3-ketoacid CoA transferase
MSKKKLVGPNGVIDIALSTRSICFITTFTAKGLNISAGNGKLKIEQEGKDKKFVHSITRQPSLVMKPFVEDKSFLFSQIVL